MKVLSLILITFLLCSCITTEPSYYKIGSQMVMPDSFHAGSQWAFVLLNHRGEIVKSVVFEVTDNVILKTCQSDEQKQLKIISENPTGYPTLDNPTYSTNGAAFRISFSPEWCDANYALIGQLTEIGAYGIHMSETLSVGDGSDDDGGKFYGFPIILEQRE